MDLSYSQFKFLKRLCAKQAVNGSCGPTVVGVVRGRGVASGVLMVSRAGHGGSAAGGPGARLQVRAGAALPQENNW